MTTQSLSEYILFLLQNNLNLYFNVKNNDDQTVKIRVSNHRMNERNNNGDRALSFVSGWDGKQEGLKSDYEWLIENDGECPTEQTDLNKILELFELNNVVITL